MFITMIIIMGLNLIILVLSKSINLELVERLSSINQSIDYGISGIWGNHDGSLIMLILIINIYSLSIMIKSNDETTKIKKRSLLILILTLVIFNLVGANGNKLGQLLWSKLNYEQMSSELLIRDELVPNLEDLFLLIHPPILYIGYFSLYYLRVYINSHKTTELRQPELQKSREQRGPATTIDGCGVTMAGLPFAMRTEAALPPHPHMWGWTQPRVGHGRAEARGMNRYAIQYLSILTLGIGLGSWWAYNELGWGGYWYWDPVENASLWVWMYLVCLVHTNRLWTMFATARKTENFQDKMWLIGVLITGVAIYLVRSGNLESVHSFIKDELKGIMIGIVLLSYTIWILWEILDKYLTHIWSAQPRAHPRAQPRAQPRVKGTYNMTIKDIKIYGLLYVRILFIIISISLILLSLPYWPRIIVLLNSLGNMITMLPSYYWNIIKLGLEPEYWSSLIVSTLHKYVLTVMNMLFILLTLIYQLTLIRRPSKLIVLEWLIILICCILLWKEEVISASNLFNYELLYLIIVLTLLILKNLDTSVQQGNAQVTNKVAVITNATITNDTPNKTRQWQILVVHIIISMIILIIVISSTSIGLGGEEEVSILMKIGDSVTIRDLKIQLIGIQFIEGLNNISQQALISVSTETGEIDSIIGSEKRYYELTNDHLYKTSIISTLWNDIFVGVSNGSVETGWMVKVKLMPYVGLMWLMMGWMVLILVI